MSDNVVRILERGERLENLDSRTEALNQSVSRPFVLKIDFTMVFKKIVYNPKPKFFQSQSFKTTARRVQRNMCLKNLKWTIILSVFVFLLVTLIIVLILNGAGVFDHK